MKIMLVSNNIKIINTLKNFITTISNYELQVCKFRESLKYYKNNSFDLIIIENLQELDLTRQYNPYSHVWIISENEIDLIKYQSLQGYIKSDTTKNLVYMAKIAINCCEMNRKKTFHERLKILRESKGIKQSDLANQIGLTRSAVASYEQNQCEPSIKKLIQISSYFNVSIDFLLGVI